MLNATEPEISRKLILYTYDTQLRWKDDMKTHLNTPLMLVGIVASLYGVVANAGEVLFLQGGYTEMCSIAAGNRGTPRDVVITGTLLGTSALEICTLAIRNAENISSLAASYNNRGVVLFDQGSMAEALSDFEQATNRDDTLGQAYMNVGHTLIVLERWADSIVALDKGIALGSDKQAIAHFERAIAHEELGHVREAYQDYLKAAELDPLWEEPKQELTRFTVRSRSPGG